MSISDDFLSAMKELIANIAVYRDDLRAGGHIQDADRMGNVHGELVESYGQLNALALANALAEDDTATTRLTTINNQMEADTKNLDHQQKTVTWVFDLATAVVGVISATATGGAIGTAIGTLYTTFTNKPPASGELG